MFLLGYFVAGIIAWAAWENLSTEGRLAYVAVFPMHAAVLWYLTRLLTFRDPAGRHILNNGWVWWPVGIIGGLLCAGC